MVADAPSLGLTGAMKLPDKVLNEVEKWEVDEATVDKAEWEDMWEADPGVDRELSENELDPDFSLREDERSPDV